MIEFGKKRPETANQNEEFILRDAEGEEIPQEMQTAMKMAGMGERPMPVPTLVPPPAPPISPLIPPSKKSTGDVEQSNVSLTTREIIEKLKQKQKYEEVLLPSRNMLYTQYGLGIDKPIHIKPMTIEEEKILSTPRMIRSGQALNKIYEACILEDIPITKILALIEYSFFSLFVVYLMVPSMK